MNNPSEISKEWYAYAERDLITAKHLVKTLYPVPLEIVCYHCQQSSEKFLKGYIADQNKVIPKTYDLSEKLDGYFSSAKVCFLREYYTLDII